MPPVFALVVQMVSNRVRSWAESVARVRGNANPVDLAVYVFAHFSFFFAAATAIISCLANLLVTSRQTVPAVGIFAVVVFLIVWFTFWFKLSGHDIDHKKGRAMSISSYVIIAIVGFISVYSLRYPKTTSGTLYTPETGQPAYYHSLIHVAPDSSKVWFVFNPERDKRDFLAGVYIPSDSGEADTHVRVNEGPSNDLHPLNVELDQQKRTYRMTPITASKGPIQ